MGKQVNHRRPPKAEQVSGDVVPIFPEPAIGGGEADLAADGTTLGRQALQDLETKLLTGQLLPGARISLRSLANSIGVSMQPVREAVGCLVASSALEITANRSMRVPTLNRDVAHEIWSMRLLLEGEAAARFAERKRPDEVRRLFDFNRTLRRHRFGVDLVPTMSTTMGWNIGLARGSGSSILIDMISSLRLRYAPIIAQALSVDIAHDEEFLQFTMHIQDELLLSIEAGDAGASRHLRCADIRSFQRYLFGRLGW